MKGDLIAGPTLVLTEDGVECAFDRATKAWHYRDGRKVTFFELAREKPSEPGLKVKYPRHCLNLMLMFLGAHDYRVLTGYWYRDGKTSLKEVVSDLNRAFKRLGYGGTSPIQLLRTDGYELSSNFLGQPAWMFQSDLPRLRWVERLVEMVGRGGWTEVRVLPGDGAGQVHDILRKKINDARIVSVNLDSIENERELLESIASEAEDYVNPAGMNHYQIVRAVADSNNLLGIVVKGLGALAQNEDPESLKRVAKALQGFKNVKRPTVALVLLSPTPHYHILPGYAVGSVFNELQLVSHSNEDVVETERWARERLAGIPEHEARRLIKAACGQLGAILRAVEAVRLNQSQEERLRAIREAHEYAGERILGAVGPCCRKVLLGKSRQPGICFDVLKGAGIIEERNGETRPRVPEWAASWVEAGRAK